MLNAYRLNKLIFIIYLLGILPYFSYASCPRPVDWKGLRLKSFETIFYRGNDLPPPPTDYEQEQARQKVLKSSAEEKELIQEIYSQDLDLWSYALRDTDGDGLKDFQVNDYLYDYNGKKMRDGKFIDGDWDLDGDGIYNVYDSSPYDKKVGGVDFNSDGIPDQAYIDINANRIPDHIDWSIIYSFETPKYLVQKYIFDQYKIILVERSARFNLELLLNLKLALDLLFKNHWRGPVLPLVQITADDIESLHRSSDEGTNAIVFGEKGSMTIYSNGLTLPSILQLGLLVHELAHAYQFTFDLDNWTQRAKFFITRVDDFPRFEELNSKYNWSSEELKKSTNDFDLFARAYEDVSKEYRFMGLTSEEWDSKIEKLISKKGNDWVFDAEISEAGIVGKYSLSSMWEWQSDNLMAYVYVKMFDYVKVNYSESVYLELRKQVDAELWEHWGDFHPENIRRSPFLNYLNQNFPLNDFAVEQLVKRYLVPRITKMEVTTKNIVIQQSVPVSN